MTLMSVIMELDPTRKGFDHFLICVTFQYRGLNHLGQYCI